MRKLFYLEPDVTFLNHGSYGACPRQVMHAYHALQIEMEQQPCRFLKREFNQRLAKARATLAAMINANKDDVVFMPNATTAENAVARSIELQSGDEIVTSDHEYGAVNRTWQFVCEKSGAVYRQVPIPLPLPSDEEIVELLWQGVTKRTKVIHLSHITSPTAVIFPVAAICARAHAEGIVTVIDGAHAIGQVPLDMQTINADFYTSNCHKWLCAPKGSAFLHVHKRSQRLLEPLIVSWGWRSEEQGPSPFIDENEWVGTRDPCAFLAIDAVATFLQEHHWDQVREDCHQLALKARTALNALVNQPDLCTERQFSQMFTVRLPGQDGPALQKTLQQVHNIEVLGSQWNDMALLRTSIQGYNTEQDIDHLLSALKKSLT